MSDLAITAIFILCFQIERKLLRLPPKFHLQAIRQYKPQVNLIIAKFINYLFIFLTIFSNRLIRQKIAS